MTNPRGAVQPDSDSRAVAFPVNPSAMDPDDATPVALAAYLRRIECDWTPRVDLETLRRLHLAHVAHIPFENIDPLLGRPVRMDLASVQTKLVGARRGGYCFEQNTLFAGVLEHLGFAVQRLAARVHVNTTRVLPRTHMLLCVGLAGRFWICDVGFGTWGLVEPLELQSDRDTRQGDWTLRLTRTGDLYTLQCPQCAAGLNLYSFTLEPQLAVDFEPANHYCSTHPRSRFVVTLTAQRAGLHQRVLLRNREFIVSRSAGNETRLIAGEQELRRLLADRFGIELPADTPSLLERIDRNATTGGSGDSAPSRLWEPPEN
jgi:N-hydroxyarylamine O-acetyltransferase